MFTSTNGNHEFSVKLTEGIVETVDVDPIFCVSGAGMKELVIGSSPSRPQTPTECLFSLKLISRLYASSNPVQNPDESPIVHLFLSSTSPDEQHFLNSAYTARNEVVRIPAERQHYALIMWHYRHSVLNCWGGAAIKPRLYSESFPEGEDDYRFACLYNLEEDSCNAVTPPTSSVF